MEFRSIVGTVVLLKGKVQGFNYAKWPSKWFTNESLVWDFYIYIFFLMTFFVCLFLIDLIFFRLAGTAVSGSPSITWLSRKWRQSGDAVAILDCSLNVYACGRQKALAMPTYCVAANCNNSQATQSITMHELPRNRLAMGRRWVQFVPVSYTHLTLPTSLRV